MKVFIPALLLVSMIGFTGCSEKNVGTDAATASSSTQGGVTNVTNAELKALLAKKVTLIDIRLPEEWKETGVIEGSKQLTLFEANGQVSPTFADTIQKIAPPDKPVALICRSGNRTKAGTAMLVGAGYKQVYNVTNGIKGWINEGNPLSPLQ